MTYHSTPKDRRRAQLLGVSYVLLAIALAAMLFKIWPPVPWPSDKDLEDNPAAKKALADVLAECKCAAISPTASSQAANPTSTATVNPTLTPAVTGTGTSQTPLATQSPTPAASAPIAGETTPSESPTPSPTPTAAPTSSQALVTNIPIKFLYWCISTTFDERLIMLVIIAGILGSFVHGATSLADYIGNDNFNKSWTWFYLLRPTIGMALALVFYFVIRGGFLTTSGGAKDINPYGIAALAGLVGMFSKQATDKLSEVFTTLFRAAPGEGDEKRKGSLKSGPITVTSVNPQSVPAGSTNQVITVTGTNFVDDSTVHLNDAAQVTTFVSATQLTVQVDDALLEVPATLKLKVVNEDGSESPAIDFTVS
jgi:uncharacterized membrane protein YeaQ/YmgE (transglycosylase-associated protein family)